MAKAYAEARGRGTGKILRFTLDGRLAIGQSCSTVAVVVTARPLTTRQAALILKRGKR